METIEGDRTRRSEAELAASAATGDGAAFRSLTGRHLDRILGVCYRTCLDREEAEAVCAGALRAAARRLPEIKLTGSGFGPVWLSAAVGPALDDAVRRAAPGLEGPLAPEPPEATSDPETALRTADHQLLVRSAVARLHPRHRKLLALADGAGLSCWEISATLGEPERAVAASLARARLRLASELRSARPEAVAGACAALLPAMTLAAEGLSGPGETATLSDHLAGCETCARRKGEIAAARAAYARWLDVVPSPALLGVVASQLPGDPGRADRLSGLRDTSTRRAVSAITVLACAILVAGAARLDEPALEASMSARAPLGALTAPGSAVDGPSSEAAGSRAEPPLTPRTEANQPSSPSYTAGRQDGLDDPRRRDRNLGRQVPTERRHLGAAQAVEPALPDEQTGHLDLQPITPGSLGLAPGKPEEAPQLPSQTSLPFGDPPLEADRPDPAP